MAEKVFVVKVDARNDRDGWRKNVGSIQAATEADFEHAKFNAVTGEGFERHGGDAFEIGRMRAQFAGGEEFFDQDLNARQGFCERLVADFLSIDANAFVDSFEMG